MQGKTPLSIKQRVRKAIAADPKKSSLMGVLAVIMVFLWIRMGSNGPAAATASFIRRSVAAIADPLSQFPRAPSSNPVLDWLAEPRRPVDRNLFAVHLDYYARAADHGGVADSSEDPEKSASEAADQNRERQILLENLQTQAAKLKLQTTVMGPTPSALVNGELVRAGDTVEGFKVVKIEPRRIVVEQDGVVLEIGMP